MDIDIIRYFGAAYVMESNLAPKEKCNLIDFIKEAEWDQILNLVFNGNPPSRKLTINEQYILESQAENFVYPLVLRYMTEAKGKKFSTQIDKDLGQFWTSTKGKFKDLGEKGKKKGKQSAPYVKRFGKLATGALILAAATAAGHRIYKSYLQKAARQCSKLGRTEKRECIVRIRKQGYQAKLNAYIKARSDCSHSKNPPRCQRLIDNKIKRVKYKMGTLHSRL